MNKKEDEFNSNNPHKFKIGPTDASSSIEKKEEPVSGFVQVDREIDNISIKNELIDTWMCPEVDTSNVKCEVLVSDLCSWPEVDTSTSQIQKDQYIDNVQKDPEWIFVNIISVEDAVKFLQEFNMIPKKKLCKNKHEMQIKAVGKSVSWTCHKKICNTKISIRKNTWLEGSRISLRTIIIFIYSWSQEYTSMKYCEKELEISHTTAVDFNKYLRMICAMSLVDAPAVIGGAGLTVEIDETCYSKREYVKGGMLPEQWAFGGVCRETEEVFLYAVPRRDEETLLSCIKANIRPGTTIINDKWEGYKNLGKLEGYNYFTEPADQSDNFADPNSGAQTRGVMKHQNKRHRGTHQQMVDSYFCEFIWRKRNRRLDLFSKILKDVVVFNKRFCHVE